MRIQLLTISLLAFTLGLLSCTTTSTISSSPRPEGPVILNFQDKVFVTKKDFEYVYQKNNGGWDEASSHKAEEFQEYLDLYINFKRKVMEAESLGLHETEEFKKEFSGYVKQLSQPYLVEKRVQDDLVTEAIERSKSKISASHILFRVSADAPPSDTLVAYKKALNIRDSIVNHGKNFGKMAKRHSTDPSAKSNDGYLGYFSVFDMVYPFESGAYSTPIGNTSEPVRSGFGYHLIQVKDKIKTTGKKTAAHIIVRVGPQYSARDTASALKRIEEIYQKLEAGESFSKLAADYSDDPVSAQNGGDLGSGRLIPIMEELKIKLNKGDYSKPFNTSFGWHILSVNNVEDLKPEEEIAAELKSKVSRDARSNLSREILIDRVKKEHNFTINTANLKKFNEEAIGDANIYAKGFWKPVDSLHSGLYGLELLTIGLGAEKTTQTIKDFIDFYLANRRGVEAKFIADITNNLLKSFSNKKVIEFEETQLPKKYPEYRELVKEYRDGILLFTLTENKVWKKAVEDTTGLKNYYSTHSDQFIANERVVIKEYQTSDEKIAKKVQELIKNKTPDAEIEKTINESSALNLKIRIKTIEEEKDDPSFNLFGKPEGFTSPIYSQDDNFRIAIIQENIPAGYKSFDDSRSECITKYQNHLEENWLSELSEKYPVIVNQEVFNNLFKK